MSPELGRRVAFTLGALIVYRIGSYIPLPGTDIVHWSQVSGLRTPGLFGAIALPAGAAARHFAIFALGILPYISAAILVQLVCVGSSRLRGMSAAGDHGRARVVAVTFYVTIALAAFQAYGLARGLEGVRGLVVAPGPAFRLTTVASLTAGTLLLIWLSNQITARGIGNGLALVLAVGFLIDLPEIVALGVERARMGYISFNMIAVAAVLAALITMLIVVVESARRVVALVFPPRTIGGRSLGETSANLPFKLNGAGLLPTVFAGWVIAFLAFGLILGAGANSSFVRQLGHGHALFMVLSSALVVLLTLVYTAFVIDPERASEQLKTYGGVVRGVLPGEATAAYLDAVLSRITLIGALYLALVFVVPELLIVYLGLPFYLGGAPFLVVVCAALDIGAQVKQHAMLRTGS